MGCGAATAGGGNDAGVVVVFAGVDVFELALVAFFAGRFFAVIVDFGGIACASDWALVLASVDDPAVLTGGTGAILDALLVSFTVCTGSGGVYVTFKNHPYPSAETNKSSNSM